MPVVKNLYIYGGDMAKTYTHSLVWKDLGRHDNGIDLLIHLAHETGERAVITDKEGNVIAGIVTAKDLKHLEGVESRTN